MRSKFRIGPGVRYPSEKIREQKAGWSHREQTYNGYVIYSTTSIYDVHGSTLFRARFKRFKEAWTC